MSGIFPILLGGGKRRRLILDGVSQAALMGAYSVRRLRSRYRGPLIRVRRSSDNAEQDFGTGQNLLRWEEAKNFIGTGQGFCTAWYDQSGLGRNFLQATGAAQPRVIQASNGWLAIRGNGVDRQMATASFPDVSQPVSFNSAYRSVALENPNFANWWSATSSDFTHFARASGPIPNGLHAGTLLTPDSGVQVYPIGVRGTVSGLFNGASSFIAERALLTRTTTGSVGSLTVVGGITLFNFAGFSGRFAYPEYQELIFYNASLNENRATSYNDEAFQFFAEPIPQFDGRTDVAALYSMKRQRSAYSGPLIRVRRSSDNSEQDFGTGFPAVLWHQLFVFGGTNNFITKWYDQSGNGRDLVQATAANQPRIILADNGYPAVLSDGTDDTMATTSFVVAQPLSFNFVYRRAAATKPDFQNAFTSAAADSVTLYHSTGAVQASSTNNMFSGTAFNPGNTAAHPVGTRGSVGGTFNGASSLMEVSSALLASFTGNVGAGGLDGLRLFTNQSLTTARFDNIEVQQFVIFNSAHGVDQLRADNAIARQMFSF